MMQEFKFFTTKINKQNPTTESFDNLAFEIVLHKFKNNLPITEGEFYFRNNLTSHNNAIKITHISYFTHCIEIFYMIFDNVTHFSSSHSVKFQNWTLNRLMENARI